MQGKSLPDASLLAVPGGPLTRYLRRNRQIGYCMYSTAVHSLPEEISRSGGAKGRPSQVVQCLRLFGYASNSVGRINLYCRALSTSWPSTRDSAQTSSMRHTSNAVIATLIFGISIPLIAHSLSVMLKFRPVGRPPAPTSSVAACHRCYLIWFWLQHRHLLLKEGSINPVLGYLAILSHVRTHQSIKALNA